ncbi:MAG: methyltransferase domain-containing protein [Bacteroidota bacterium]
MEKQNIISGFLNVDNTQPEFLKNFLEEVSKRQHVRESFEIQLGLLEIHEGDQVLDIGCGIGVQAKEMAALVGKTGMVTGTDLSTAMIDIAQNSTATSGLPLKFMVADAVHQPFVSESFDCLRTERVLMYIKDTAAAFTEFKRLLKPGGRLVVFDTDWDAMMIAHTDKALTRKIVRYVSDSFPSGRVGGELFHYLKDNGFKDVKVKPFSYTDRQLDVTKKICEGVLQTGVSEGVFTANEIAAWWEVLKQDLKNDKFFASYSCFIVSGTK